MNINLVRECAEKALAKKHYMFETVVCGFCFQIVYDDIPFKGFRITESFIRGWGHTNGMCADTVDEVVEVVQKKVIEDLKDFINGGDYALEYRYKVSVSAEGYEDTTFEDEHVARTWYYKLINMGLNAALETIPFNRNM